MSSLICRFHVLLPLVQNSCTTRYFEAESACIQNMQDISQLKYGSASNLSNIDIEMLQECDRWDNESVVHEGETKGIPYFLASPSITSSESLFLA